MNRSQLKKLRRRKKIKKALNMISNNFDPSEKHTRLLAFDTRRSKKVAKK